MAGGRGRFNPRCPLKASALRAASGGEKDIGHECISAGHAGGRKLPGTALIGLGSIAFSLQHVLRSVMSDQRLLQDSIH